MDELSSGKPLSMTYFDLWCRARDEAFVKAAGREVEMAFASGFSGQRAKQTWTQRIDGLNKLGFIRLADGPAGPRSYILILNPYLVVQKLRSKKGSKISDASWNALMQRMSEVGATDLD